MRDYTKTGKKIKTIDSNLIDLTYNDFYDVFIDNDGDEFIIDDVGDKRYECIDDKCYYELVDDVDEVTNTTDDIHDTNETKPKFKVGDKVKVVNIDYISQHIDNVNVGVIVSIDNNDNITPYLVKFDDYDVRENWWFTDKCIELVEDNTANDIHDTNETKLKFKVGDKVKVVNVKQISQWTDTVEVGCVGLVVDVNVNVEDTPYKVKLDKCYYDWWFTDKCIELVEDNTDTIENDHAENTPIKSDGSQIVSDGGSSSYYAQQIPKGMLERFNTTGIIEAKDVIRLFLGNDFNMGNIFKAYCRIISLRNGKGKAGIDEQYDLTKAKYFTEDELNFYLENKNV